MFTSPFLFVIKKNILKNHANSSLDCITDKVRLTEVDELLDLQSWFTKKYLPPTLLLQSMSLYISCAVRYLYETEFEIRAGYGPNAWVLTMKSF